MKYKIHNVSLLFYFSQLTFKKLRKENNNFIFPHILQLPVIFIASSTF